MAIDRDGPFSIVPTLSDLSTDNAHLHSCYGRRAALNVAHGVSWSGPVLVSEAYGDGSNTSFTYNNLSALAPGESEEVGLGRGGCYVPEPYNALRYSITAFDNSSVSGDDVTIHIGAGKRLDWGFVSNPAGMAGTWKRTQLSFAGISEGDAGSRVQGVLYGMNFSMSDRMVYWWVSSDGCDVASFHLSAEMI